MRRIATLLTFTFAVSFTVSTAFGATKPIARAKNPIKGEYLVRVRPSVASALGVAFDLARAHGGEALDFIPDIQTMFVKMSDAQAIALNAEPLVRSIEENAILEASPTQTGVDYPPSGSGQATLWGLDRLDQASFYLGRLDNSYSWTYDGTGVRIYMIDTGIYAPHAQFGGRVDQLPELATYLHNLPGGPYDLGPQCWAQPGGGIFTAAASHGTATASVAGGQTLGVAKGATLVDARGADCGGNLTTYRVTKIVDWICRLDPRQTPGRMVISMSFSGLYHQGDPNDQALQAEINTAVDTYNIPVVCAAGNDNANEFWYTPGNAARAITVGGLNKDTDTRWQYSNYGYTVSFYAPAQYIEAASTVVRDFFPTLLRDQYRSELGDCASYPQDTCTSGTSFSAPHMSGIIARYLQIHPGATRNQIVNDLAYYNCVYSNCASVTEPGGSTRPVLVVGTAF